MRIESVLFAGKRHVLYERMARVLAKSALAHNQPLTIHRIEDEDLEITKLAGGPHRLRNYVDNTRKTKHHAQLVEEAADGELLCFIDADAMILGDLREAEMFGDYDLAITRNPVDIPFRINTGVYFVRVSDKMRDWHRQWYSKCYEMLGNEELHLEYRGTFGGINQSSLGWMLQHVGGIKVIELECQEWNCTAHRSAAFDERTKVAHFMHRLRDYIQRRCHPPNANIKTVVDLWFEYDAAEKGEAA